MSAFPALREDWRNGTAEARMELLMGIITGIRNIRSEAEIHPSMKIEAFVVCPDQEKADLIGEFTQAIIDMTRLSGLTVQRVARSRMMPPPLSPAISRSMCR